MVEQIMTDVEHYVVDRIGEFLALRNQRDDVLMSFVTNMNLHFDELLDKELLKEEAVVDYDSLSLVQEEDLETMMALEGMVNYSRNEHLSHFICFNTRLNSLFTRKHIDETSSPLDPEQIAKAFLGLGGRFRRGLQGQTPVVGLLCAQPSSIAQHRPYVA